MQPRKHPVPALRAWHAAGKDVANEVAAVCVASRHSQWRGAGDAACICRRPNTSSTDCYARRCRGRGLRRPPETSGLRAVGNTGGTQSYPRGHALPCDPYSMCTALDNSVRLCCLRLISCSILHALVSPLTRAAHALQLTASLAVAMVLLPSVFAAATLRLAQRSLALAQRSLTGKCVGYWSRASCSRVVHVSWRILFCRGCRCSTGTVLCMTSTMWRAGIAEPAAMAARCSYVTLILCHTGQKGTRPYARVGLSAEARACLYW
jgi:hypothetical protein